MEYWAKHSGQTIERVKQDSDRDNFMTAEAARATSLVDSMLEKRGDIPAQSLVKAKDTEEVRASWSTRHGPPGPRSQPVRPYLLREVGRVLYSRYCSRFPRGFSADAVNLRTA